MRKNAAGGCYRTFQARRHGRRVQRWTAALVLAAATALAPPAFAHQTGLAFLDLQVKGATVDGALDVPGTELAQALFIDANRDGLLDRSDIEASQKALCGWLASSVRLVSDGRLCEGRGVGAELREDLLVTVRAQWTCAGDVGELQLSSRISDSLGDAHSTFVRATRGSATAQALLTRTSGTATLSLGGGGALQTAGRFVLLGIEHIFSGVDHVLFLLALLMLGGSLRRIIGIATAFTVAHSITLSLAALDVVHGVPSRLVESAIALSIAYVAVENYLLAPPPTLATGEPAALRWRWLITFAFGLVHGFGFASALRETGLPHEHLPVALAAFNVGVELGQVAIVALAWPVLSRAVATAWYRPRGVQFASLGVFAVAVYWFVQRAF